MHVCMLTDYFFPQMIGGTERVVYEISRQLVKKGHEVTVITLDVYGREKRGQVEGVEIYRLPAVSATKLVGAQLTVSPLALFKANQIIRSIRPDIVHAHNLYFNLTAIAPAIKRLNHLPLVTTIHLPKVQINQTLMDPSIQIYQNTIGRLIAKHSDKLIAVSRSVLAHTIKDLKTPSSKITLIPNGVDTSVYKPNKQARREATITYVGRLIRNKGPQHLIQACSHIVKDHPEAQILIVGKGPLEDKLKQQVESEKLESQIHFLGHVPDVLPILQRTTIFVRPSLTEGMSLAILEAMACGIPVVASNVKGNAEIVEHGRTGLLVPPANPQALAQAIGFLLTEQKTAFTMGANARKLTEELYDWKQLADKTIEAYRSL